MGVLDQLESMLGGEGGSIIDQVKNMATEKGISALAEQNPQIAQMLKGVDQDTIQNIISNITENGMPKSMEDIQKLIAKFTK